MLGFVVRRCAHAIGHDPSPEEFAAWANTYREEPFDRPTHLFGRPITVAEAEVILRNPGRLVRTRLGPPSPGDQPELPQANVAGARVIVLQPRDRLRNAGQK
ncbi:MAG: hypothetical protein N3C12_05045 [Candidatus Binatia bacterium]|nr:hypothetical protein [Candidatus Binatia bacterium]